MDDAVDPDERVADELAITDVAVDELDAVREHRALTEVHLFLEAVQHDHLVAALEQPRDEVLGDEPGTAGNERPHRDALCVRRGRCATPQRSDPSRWPRRRFRVP